MLQKWEIFEQKLPPLDFFWQKLDALSKNWPIFYKIRNFQRLKWDFLTKITPPDLFLPLRKNLWWHYVILPVTKSGNLQEIVFNSWTLIFDVISWFSWCLVLWFFFDFAFLILRRFDATVRLHFILSRPHIRIEHNLEH